jgi:SpoVK/Ycf46/Vps4 family AAA+-type ATPase
VYRLAKANGTSKKASCAQLNSERREFKWIRIKETKNAILFFDEADALFGIRSEVKDSHDRYANIDINYLLQRMQAYNGLAILATNKKDAFDAEFLRRFRYIIDFPGL